MAQLAHRRLIYVSCHKQACTLHNNEKKTTQLHTTRSWLILPNFLHPTHNSYRGTSYMHTLLTPLLTPGETQRAVSYCTHVGVPSRHP